MGDTEELNSLPLDVLRSIWNYLSLPDVIRFGMAIKNMLNLTWPYYQEISMTRDWPINALSFLLSRDLSHVRYLELMRPSKKELLEFLSENLSTFLRQLESLKFSKLSSLYTLMVDLEFPDELDDIKKGLDCINRFIFSNTHLHSLYWYTAQVEENFNIGQFFVAHTRLTMLTIQTDKKLIGFDMMTHLKELGLSFCEHLNDDMLLDVMKLTQLRFLDCSNDNITDLSFSNISNLTNLEKLEMKHSIGIASALNLLTRLPKLRYLTLKYPWDFNEEEFSAAASIIGQLSKLTYLQFYNYDRQLDFNTLTNLTNLMELDINANTDSADFSTFLKLTTLEIPRRDFKFSTFPPNIEYLYVTELTEEENAKTICGLSKLRQLCFRTDNFDGRVLIPWISQLTSLSSLFLITTNPKGLSELITALQQLPNLASLILGSALDNDKIIEELAKLTQLMELTYWKGYRKDLKAKLPFNIRYIGRI